MSGQQALEDVLRAWQAGDFGYREALTRTGLGNLFALYEACRRCGVPLCKELTAKEEGVAALVTADLLGERQANAHDVTERFKAILRRLRQRADRHGTPLDLTDIGLRRRAYRAARRIEEARFQRGDTRPFLADDHR